MRDNLPREPYYLQPAALLRIWIASFGQPIPVVIHFLLCRAIDLQRDGLVEFENGAAIECGKGSPFSSKAIAPQKTL